MMLWPRTSCRKTFYVAFLAVAAMSAIINNMTTKNDLLILLSNNNYYEHQRALSLQESSSSEPSIMSSSSATTTSEGREAGLPTSHLPHPYGKSASLCVMVKDVELYIDEFVDYYFGIGFSNIYFYDNSDENTLKGWQPSTPLQRHQTARIIHFPGPNLERAIARECSLRLKEETNTTWVAFFSIDEFLVMRKHNHIVDLLQEHCPRGGLAVSWVMIGASSTSFYGNFYRNLPVTRRFFHRASLATDRHVKSIVHLEDMDLQPTKFRLSDSQKSVHTFYTLHNTTTVDSNGKEVKGPWNVNGPMDVVALYHYYTKSQSEFNIKACRVGQAKGTKPHCGRKAMRGQVYDDSVWVQMKKHVPKYAIYDQFYVDEQQV